MLEGSSIGNYKILHVLRPGSGGNVYVVENVNSHEKFVLKSSFVEVSKRDEFKRLTSAWKSMSASCEFVVFLKDSFFEGPNAYVLMEYCEGGDLETLIEKRKKEGVKFNEYEISKIIYNIFCGLRAMHAMNIIHRDVKTANVLISKDGIYKIADFNVSRKLDEDRTQSLSLAGTLRYVAPEIFLDKRYSFLSDAYSVGAVLYEVITLTPAFSGSDIPSIVANKYAPIDSSLGYSSDLLKLVHSLLSLDPAARPSPEDVLANPFLERTRIQSVETNQHTQGELLTLCMKRIDDLTVALNAEKAKVQALQAAFLVRPDYSKPIVKKKFDSEASSGEVLIAEVDGWVLAQGRAEKKWVCLEVNGEKIRTKGDKDDNGSFFSIYAHCTLFYPLRKGDRYRLVGGDYHSITFFPCVDISV